MRTNKLAVKMTSKDALALVLIALAGFYAMWATSLHTWIPGVEVLVETPHGYQSSRAFRAARNHDFPALRDEPPPAPVGGTGHLLRVRDGTPYGTSGATTGTEPAPDVMTLFIRPVFGPMLVAHLDVPLHPRLHEHLLNLRKGAVVTVAGIGHGDGEHNIYIYPIHQVDGIEP